MNGAEENLPEDLKRVEEALHAAALAGGKILKEYFRSEKVQAKTKSSYADLVTNVDIMSQGVILNILSAELPGVQIVGEEKENEKVSGEAIYLDPLDGTLNYYHGLNQFAVSLGYWAGNRPMAGVVYNPVEDELFSAVSGKGAFRNGKPIRVSPAHTLSQSFLATGWPYDKSQTPAALRSLERLLFPSQEVRVLGSSALALCYVAAGILEGYWEWGLYPWDIAAGILMVKEAGGRITSPEGNSFHLESGAILATNGYVHEEMLGYLKKESKNGEWGMGNGE
jgi:myo-inositol-1(or 4)-monophosphatase